MSKELTWEMIEQALDEKRLEILEDYNYLGWLQDEMAKIRHKYETPEKQEELADFDWNFIREDA